MVVSLFMRKQPLLRRLLPMPKNLAFPQGFKVCDLSVR